MQNLSISIPTWLSDHPILWVPVSFSIFGTYLGPLLFIGQNVLERKTALNRLLSLLFICLGLLQASGLCFIFGLYSLPHLILLHIPVLGSIGPILYGIHRIIQNSEVEKSAFGLSAKHAILPAIIWFFFLLSFLPDTEKIRNGILVFASEVRTYDLVFYIPLIILAGYILGLLRGTRILFKLGVLKEEWTARVLLYIIIATIVNHSIGAFFLVGKNSIFLLISASMMALSLCISYLIGRRYPAYFQNLQEVARVTNQKYARSLLQGMDIQVLRENLLQTMEREKLFQDEDLSLASLADELGLSSHQLSELINQEMGKNFSVFVNEYRIKEACRLLQEKEDRSILDIAYEVGFRSKTSFHRAFTKQVGVPPSEFREKRPK
ncbi:AraC family transcriptional regulator [Leptospira langatensis]|uniref:AraC family transcriptional regulator n=1 Tax=Leptospira langatensis TaxID=2484983 RepID=A0A5F1ZTZ2_9LEPT|nr:helix-turn-helix domain-containing protein [Leptospira langatensis]TGJ99028.1 AraC family transcriptional regulator [Leptospira langatensis]TGL40403.1 AraC family transcriptional regulator [Leptospira langatensis]